jgi:aspartyl-tRNA(Asn)/glutamyl-tRNA(Gln) amidotransferase subunit A
MSGLHRLGAAELGEKFATGELKPTELLEHLIARIATLDPRVHAFVRLDADAARAQAAAAERELRAGRSRGPLHGVPVGIKDLIDVAGLPTTCHSAILLDNVARSDASVVTRLRQAGAVILGKLATHEFAIGGPAFDLPFPPARNPWNLDHHPGGSSSGSGAGVAACLFPLALGTDTGGSVRHPASACGIVGVKPTYGFVSTRGVFPLSVSLDHVGPLARTVRDAALLIDTIAGPDPADPGSAYPHPPAASIDLDQGLRGLRIGYVRHFHEKDVVADPEVAAALDHAAKVFSAEGAAVRDLVLPPLTEFADVNRVILSAEAFAVHGGWLRDRPGDYAQITRRNILPGAFLSAEDYVLAQRRRGRMVAAVEQAFADVDILLTASSLDPASRLDDEQATARTYPRHARTPFNLSGHPALAMMSGLSRAGLPLSVQLAARRFDERTLLRAARGYERAMGLPAFPPLAE